MTTYSQAYVITAIGMFLNCTNMLLLLFGMKFISILKTGGDESLYAASTVGRSSVSGSTVSGSTGSMRGSRNMRGSQTSLLATPKESGLTTGTQINYVKSLDCLYKEFFSITLVAA